MLPKTTARFMVVKDGHLKLEGDETAAELREAVGFLERHVCDICPGIPVSTSMRAWRDQDLRSIAS